MLRGRGHINEGQSRREAGEVLPWAMACLRGRRGQTRRTLTRTRWAFSRLLLIGDDVSVGGGCVFFFFCFLLFTHVVMMTLLSMV